MTHQDDPRFDPRVRLRVRVDVTPRWDGATQVTAETVDLSASGTALSSPINLPIKTQVSVRLHLPAVAGLPAAEVACEAVVVNIEEIGHFRRQWRAGLFFLDMQESDRQTLNRFIYAARDACSEPGRAMTSRGGRSAS